MTSRKPRKHLRHLYELFLPEARFPDEKFWTKDGGAINPAKRPPPSQGLTMKDLGAGDDETPHAPTAKTADLFDHFSKSFPEFLSNVDHAAKKLYGRDYQKKIDDFFKRPGYIRDVIKQLWDGNWTDHEALGEIGFIFDVVQSGITGSGYYNPSHYKHIMDPKSFGTKEYYDDDTGDMAPRTKRPMSPRDLH